MVVIFWLFIVTMLILHMLRPRFRTQRLSSADFFSELPPAKNDVNKPALKPPALTPLFVIRMLAAIALLLSLFDLFTPIQTPPLNKQDNSQNLLLIVDASASMTTKITNNQSNLALAKQQIIELLEQHIDTSRPICAELTTFNTVLQPIGQFNSVAPLLAQVTQLEATTLGTDLNNLRRHISINKDKTQCPNALIVIVSDQSAPIWVNKMKKLVWHDVGEAVTNVGLINLTTNAQKFNANKQQITIQSGYWHKARPATLTVTAPGGSVLSQQSTDWSNGARWTTAFTPLQSGLHHIKITPGGAYTLDDEVTINVTINPPFTVDWQIQDTQLKTLLGWQHNSNGASLRVMPLPHDNVRQGKATQYKVPHDNKTPTLYIMPSVTSNDATLYPISGFKDNDPLLLDLNFDLIEQITPFSLPKSSQLSPVLWSKQGAWIARDTTNNAVYLPGLPQLTNSSDDKMLTVMFFNALKTLTNNTPLQPLYSLTDINNDKVTTSRLPLHSSEGNTAQPIKSHGVVTFAPQVALDVQQSSQWLLWFTIFASLMAAERILSAWGGRIWQ